MRRTPAGRALVVAGAYVTVAGAWIITSGRVAAALASSAGELERLERFKGIGFVLFTGAALFGLAWRALRRQQADAEETSRAREALLESERSAMAGLFVSALAHDARNLTMVISASLELLRADPAGSKESLDDAQAALEKLACLFRDLRQLGGGERSEARVETELVALVSRTVALLRGHGAMKGCRVAVVAPTSLRATVVPLLIDQVLINLLLTAADATASRGAIEVRLREEGDEVRLEVHDDGPGVPAEVEPRLFSAFTTTKPHGTGLGLVSVREGARAHGGRAEYARSPLGGAAFSVALPRHPRG